MRGCEGFDHDHSVSVAALLALHQPCQSLMKRRPDAGTKDQSKICPRLQSKIACIVKIVSKVWTVKEMMNC